MSKIIRIQLSFMMFLEFFIWGAWYVTMGTYLVAALHATGTQNGAAYGANALGTIISPFIVGMIADRYFPAQRFMGLLHLFGAILLYLCTQIQDSGNFFWIILAYSAVYMPTIALANSVAFNQMSEPDKEFPNIRVWGTLGWIAAGLLLGVLSYKGVSNVALTALPFLIAAGASLLLGVYSFFLPDTPPKATVSTSVAQTLGLDALSLLKDRSYLVFFLASILICIPLSFYYSFTNTFLTQAGMTNVTGKMTLGQVSEVLFMLLLPLFFKRLGIKNILLMAMLAWIARFAAFAYGNAEAYIGLFFLGIILHGLCFDFFFVAGMIYTESKAGPRIKNAAQGLITFATYGVGMFIGTNLSGWAADYYRSGDLVNWRGFWLFPAGFTVAVLVIFLLFFNDRKTVEIPNSLEVAG